MSGKCANCGAALTGAFCAGCGQSREDLHRPAWTLLTDLIGSVFVWEGRFFSTLRALYRRPGQIARDYVDGKRNTYTAPIRLYVIVSLGFFMVMAASGLRVVGVDIRPDADTIRAQDPAVIAARLEGLEPTPPPADIAPSGASTTAGSDTLVTEGAVTEGAVTEGAPANPECGVPPGPDEIDANGRLVYAQDTWVAITLFLHGAPPEGRLLTAADEACIIATTVALGAPQGIERVVVSAIKNPDLFETRIATATSQALILMVVAFALLNLLLHPRRRLIEHTIYSLYWHAAFLPLATVSAVLSRYARADEVATIVLAIATLAAVSTLQVLSDRGFYGSSWFGAVLCLPAFLIGYAVTIAVVSFGLIMIGGL